MTCRSKRIKMLTERAKSGNRYILDLDIGESCYLLSLISQIHAYRTKQISADELYHRQKELETKLESYYQHCALYDMHISIRNRYSHVLTDAEKHGCPICKKLVKIFDGRIADCQGVKENG